MTWSYNEIPCLRELDNIFGGNLAWLPDKVSNTTICCSVYYKNSTRNSGNELVLTGLETPTFARVGGGLSTYRGECTYVLLLTTYNQQLLLCSVYESYKI